jgi:hypothetical protein
VVCVGMAETVVMVRVQNGWDLCDGWETDTANNFSIPPPRNVGGASAGPTA